VSSEEQSSAEQSGAQQSGAQHGGDDQSGADLSASSLTGTNHSGTDQSTVHQPDADQSSTVEPDEGQPSVAQPGTEQPGADAAGTHQAGSAQPDAPHLGVDAAGSDTSIPAVPIPEIPVTGVPAGDAVTSTGTSAPSETIRDSAPTGPVTRHVPHVAEIWVDPQWYAFQESADPMPPQGPPRIIVLRDSALIGRHSASRNIHPDIDCEPDVGCSRRQAYLTSADGYWYVNDLDSANGTFVAPATASLPTEPITTRTQISPDMRIYVGAWTRIVIRPAIQGETGV